jgi:DNA-binding winged helix-turn-helix (wHTH) protein
VIDLETPEKVVSISPFGDFPQVWPGRKCITLLFSCIFPSGVIAVDLRQYSPTEDEIAAADGGMGTSGVISFGPFHVNRARRLVERNGEVVRLGSRAFDVLVYLLENAGQVVSNRALLEAVWPSTYVEEGNLRFQMAALRRALGDGEANYIINVPGRGYCFTAPLSKEDDVKHSPSLPSDVIVQPVSLATPPANTLPHPASQLFIEKARGTVSAASPDREEKSVAEIYTKLDDLALAIKLVASQVKVLGADRLSDLLEERWLASWPGRPVAPP